MSFSCTPNHYLNGYDLGTAPDRLADKLGLIVGEDLEVYKRSESALVRFRTENGFNSFAEVISKLGDHIQDFIEVVVSPDELAYEIKPAELAFERPFTRRFYNVFDFISGAWRKPSSNSSKNITSLLPDIQKIEAKKQASMKNLFCHFL